MYFWHLSDIYCINCSSFALTVLPNRLTAYKGKRMEVLPAQLCATLPLATAKRRSQTSLFASSSSIWTWFATVGSPKNDDLLFFGYVISFGKTVGLLQPQRDAVGHAWPTAPNRMGPPFSARSM